LSNSFALRGATLIDGTGRPALPQATVIVEGRSIAAVGNESELPIPSGLLVYDVTGKTVMPGLIDGHVHLLSYAGEQLQDIHMWNVLTFQEEQTIHAAANAVKALNAGVTTVRDMAGSRPEISVKHAMDDFVLPGARVISAGFVGMTAGHGDMFVPPHIERRLWRTVDGTAECRKLVREYARDGSDLIKICTSGGVLSKGDKSEWRNFTLEETQVIVDEAHALGMRVAAHAHTRSGIRQALAAGVDTLEHGSSLDDELIELMLKKRTWLCPTLSISEYIFESGEKRGIPAENLAKSRVMNQARHEAVAKAYRAGVPIFMGTDSCNTMPFGAHARELELLQRYAGMSAGEAIVAATWAAAQAIGLGDQTGTIEPGKWADLLVLEGDPLADLRILQDQSKLLAVFRDGRLLVNRIFPSHRIDLSRSAAKRA
jgi:imidazolonepropionase-like amidohydrolase